MKVGDRIRVLDEPCGDKGNYMVGEISAFRGDFIYCKTVSIFFQGKAVPVTPQFETFRTLRPGLVSTDTHSPRILKATDVH